MTWLKLDDGFGGHPKIAGLSDRAFRAHVLGMLYAAHYLTDGFVPTVMLPKAAVLAELERAVLWSPAPEGWVIHDFLDYNPSKADAMAGAKAKAMAGAKGAASRWHGSTYADADSKSMAVPSRPVPDPKVKKPSTPRKRDEIADALAMVEGADPLEVPRTYMRTLCVKANELRQIAPNVTPEEVLRRGANWSSHMHDATITGPAVVKFWGRLAREASSNGDIAERERKLAEARRVIEQGRIDVR